MDPYARFRLISNSVSVALVSAGVGVTAHAAGPVDQLSAAFFGEAHTSGAPAAFAAAVFVTLVVLVWLSLAHFLLPRLFGFSWMRRTILGRYYFEGTWVEGVRLPDRKRALAVIDFQPMDDRFIVNGRFINEHGETVSNFHGDYQDLVWPVVKLKHQQNRPDPHHGSREGVAEIMFESNRERPSRFDGCFIEGANQGARVEGYRLSDKDAERIRQPGDREEILAQYWRAIFADDTRLDKGGLRLGDPKL